MGIITKLSFEQIKNHLNTDYGLKLLAFDECKNGVSDSVYLLSTDKGAFVLKLFESASYSQVAAERELLAALSALPVSKTFGDISEVEGKPCVLYEAAKGLHLDKATTFHIKEIGGFLSTMHAITKDLKSTNQSFASMCVAKKGLCKDTPFEPFAHLFDEMATLPVNGVIHGDLFHDNLFFEDGKLSCAIDFIEAFEGSFAFELGVVAFAFGAKFAAALSASYGLYDEAAILSHARYAALFYGVGRYKRGGDYAPCLSFLRQNDIFAPTYTLRPGVAYPATV